jgi:hypothetical protein
MVGSNGGRRQRWRFVISRIYGRERDEIEQERIGLSDHLRGRYPIFSCVLDKNRG